MQILSAVQYHNPSVLYYLLASWVNSIVLSPFLLLHAWVNSANTGCLVLLKLKFLHWLDC